MAVTLLAKAHPCILNIRNKALKFDSLNMFQVITRVRK